MTVPSKSPWTKFREKGLMGTVRAVRWRLAWRWRALGSRVRWVWPSLRFLFRGAAPSPRRLLAICDLRTVPYSVGEILWFQAVTRMLCLQHDAERVDLLWLCDPEEPGREDQGVTAENVDHHLAGLLPLARVNPDLGTFLCMDAPEEVEAFVADHGHRYCHVEPTLRDLAGRRRVYERYRQRLMDFYQARGSVPGLSCRPGTLLWARHFLAEEVRPRLPVVVQLRGNAVWSRERNAQKEAWAEFFAHCRGRYHVRFIVIGAREEIDPALRRLDNVCFAKDHATTVEQDLALIQTSLCYLGTTSGPGVMALLSGRPLIIFNFRPVHLDLGGASQYPFATPEQKLIWEEETPERLQEEFAGLFSRVDVASWEREFAEQARDSGARLQRWVPHGSHVAPPPEEVEQG